MSYVRRNGVDIIMTITFANTNNEYFDVHKTYTTVSTFSNASIVYPCNVLNPTFKIKGGYIDANAITGVFGRNYWITDQTLNEGINYVTCSVDAFSSWENNIYNTEQFIDRSETHGNENINDGKFPIPNSNKEEMLDSNTTIITGDFTYLLGVI